MTAKSTSKNTPRGDRAKRLLDLVMLLLRARSPVTFREIREQFSSYKTNNVEAGLRAFERDKADLLELGVPIRYVTPEQDDALAAEMLADPKEVSEHVMLIDLARNDVGRVSKAGSVEVPVRMTVERYSHVMHITSEVVGQLADNLGPWDVLRATFPAGTLSGAPKVRAMQIIRELEPRPRFAYGGAVGYATRGTDLDFAIAIRTVVMRQGRFEVTAGAGLVADSVPQLEAEETRNKARAALAAIAAAKRGTSI